MTKTVEAKAIFLSGVITETDVSPEPELGFTKQLDVFPATMPDDEILKTADERIVEVKKVIISWEE